MGGTANVSLHEVPLPPTPGPRGGGAWPSPLRGQVLPLCPHRPPQGPFVHLSAMMAAYLGRVRVQATGESEVRGLRRAPSEE